MPKPGPRNLITDVDGLLVGNAADRDARTGVTVLLPASGGLVAGVDVRGGAPGTRETDLLRPGCLVERIDALCLAGGSVFGLAAADGAVQWLAAQGRGLAFGGWRVPIVPAAIIFDLPLRPPGRTVDYRALGAEACAAAAADFALGNAGAGLGARAGALKGGLGSASVLAADGLQVGALVVANPVGSVLIPGTASFWAWPLEQAGEFGRRPPPPDLTPVDEELPAGSRLAGHTTVAIVAVNAGLSKAQAERLAIMAHDGLARAIRPVHTPFDGDTVFAVSTGAVPLPDPAERSLARLGAFAADCVARAVARGVYAADDLADIPSYRTRYGAGNAG